MGTADGHRSNHFQLIQIRVNFKLVMYIISSSQVKVDHQIYIVNLLHAVTITNTRGVVNHVPSKLAHVS